MSVRLRELTRNVIQLGSGEIPARLCGIATLLVLARHSGVAIVGVYALAQGMVQYTYPFIDFGLRHVGARLVAKHPGSEPEIIRRVQKRRIRMSIIFLPCLLAYASTTNLPMQLKVFLFIFSAISCLYALSLEWAAWGKEQLRLVGLSRIIVPGSVLLFVVIGSFSEHLLLFMIFGQFSGYMLQSLMFGKWRRRQAPTHEPHAPSFVINESLLWKNTGIMGLAWFCNLAFNSIDIMMLGIMADPRQVGLYSAAYRTMNQVLFTYYLFLLAVYPRLARQSIADRLEMLRGRILFSLFGCGSVIALLLGASRHFILKMVFGPQFISAAVLLLVLAWAIPFDFVTSYLNNAYIAWGMERKLLLCTGIAAGSNIVLNLIWIPAYGALAAALNTLVSYVIYLTLLVVVARCAKGLSRSSPAHMVASS